MQKNNKSGINNYEKNTGAMKKNENNDEKLSVYKPMLLNHKRSRNIKETGLNMSGTKAVNSIT